MDIWKWVNQTVRELYENDHDRLGHLVYQIADATCDDRHHEVDAMYPEALALARQVKNPWLELYFRHWNLQSRILHRYEVGEFLSEAVSLVEFAHREDNLACPQSRCASQNLACAYGYIDGPGYAAERLDVAREALSRINAHWPCWSCISAEYAEALVDSGELQGALDFVLEQRDAIVDAGGDNIYQLVSIHAELLILVDRCEEALRLIEDAQPHVTAEHTRVERNNFRAQAFAKLGRVAEGVDILPEIDAIRDTPALYDRWASAVEALVADGDDDEGLTNSWSLDRDLRGLQNKLVANGVQRRALWMALRRARLAVRRGALHTADLCVDQAEARIPLLRTPLDAPDQIAAARVVIAAARDARPPVELPETSEALLVRTGTDPEADFELMVHAIQKFPQDEAVQSVWLSCLMHLERFEQAERVLLERRDAAPEDSTARLTLAQLYFQSGRLDDVRALGNEEVARGREAGVPSWEADGHFILARLAGIEGDDDTQRAELEATLLGIPQAVNTRILLAALHRKHKRWADALKCYDELLVLNEDRANDWHWERVIVATLLEEWDIVRESSAVLGMTFKDDSGRIVENWGVVRVRFEDGTPGNDDWAVRTGPVTAMVLSMSAPDEPQHFEDQIVFDAAPLEAPNDETSTPVLFAVLEVIEPGGYTTSRIMGADPGAAVIETLTAEVQAAGGVLRVFEGGEAASDGDEEDADTEDNGLVALLAVNAKSDHDALRAALARLDDALEGDVWIEFVDA